MASAMLRYALIVACCSVPLATVQTHAAALPAQEDPRLIPAFKADRVWNAVTTTRDNRVFVGFPGADRPGVRVEELSASGEGSPFPNAEWNSWKPGADPVSKFVRVNALRIGPDGMLWVVDSGAPGIGEEAVKGAARIIRFDLATNAVSRIYDLSSVAKPKSYVDDIRFNGSRAYITDAGEPALIVLDLETGSARRVLENHPSTIDERPMMADGRVLRKKDGAELRVPERPSDACRSCELVAYR